MDHFFRGATPSSSSACAPEPERGFVTRPQQHPTYPAEKAALDPVSLMPRDTNALGTIFGGVILS